MTIDAFSTATEVATAIRERKVSPVEVAQFYLDRIERHNPDLTAIVWVDEEATLAEARAAELALDSGSDLPPFHGVPIPIKDLHAAAGQPLFFGSNGMAGTPSAEDDPAVAALRAGGFVLMGRSHAPDAGVATTTETPRFGVARNPWDLELSPGGSSGGAAAAVAAGLAPVAHASDGGGSIRVPSSSCGLVGFKPSRGRVPLRVSAWEHASSEGAIARTVEDAAAVLDVMSVVNPLALYNAPAPERPFAAERGQEVRPLRIALELEPSTGLPVDPECVAAALLAADLLRSLGHSVIELTPRTYSAETFTRFQTHIMDAAVAAIDYDRPLDVQPIIAHRRNASKSTTAPDYVRTALHIQEESRGVVAQFGRDFDLILSPTMARTQAPAGVYGPEQDAHPERIHLEMTRMVSFTGWVNLAGLPAVSLPLHTSGSGMPVGVQLVAGPWQENLLFRVAFAIEEAAPWRSRIPNAYRG